MTSLYFYMKFNIYFNLTDTTVTTLTSPRSSQAPRLLIDTRFCGRGWVFPVRSGEVLPDLKIAGNSISYFAL